MTLQEILLFHDNMHSKEIRTRVSNKQIKVNNIPVNDTKMDINVRLELVDDVLTPKFLPLGT